MMPEIERNEFVTKIKACLRDEEQKAIIIRLLRSEKIREEYERRTEVASNKMCELINIVSNYQDDTQLEEMEDMLRSCRRTLKMD